jgi:hypothetical protein
MLLIGKLFEVLFPVFLTIGIGYWYGKKDPKFNTKFITTFAGNFGLPSIIFYSLTTTNISFELFLRFSYYITLYVLIFSVIGITILKILKKDIYWKHGYATLFICIWKNWFSYSYINNCNDTSFSF